MFSDIYTGRRVLVTGHTGFKGSWLVAWLLRLGAKVGGYSSGMPSEPCNFEVSQLKDRIQHYHGDIGSQQDLARAVDEFRPEIIFHLAAQALVRRSYREPVRTFATNTMGSLNVLEVVRDRPFVRAVVLVTSDKCYHNVEWNWGYRENDRLGGHDPYSASKACAEIIAHAYIMSFFGSHSGLAAVATARAGNVIGGGDWAEDRIVPDCMRSWSKKTRVRIRNPQATRPWQHVLEPLSGYLQLAAALWEHRTQFHGQSYNFGPDSTVNVQVARLIEELGRYWPGAEWDAEPADAGQHEAKLLKLSCDKALAELHWRPTLPFDATVRLTGEWYSEYYLAPAPNMYEVTQRQLDKYCAQARKDGQIWAQ